MDVKLPGMNGVETFFQFRKLRPGAQVIMMTGLSVEQLIARAVEGGAVSILRKPFAMGDLLDALTQVQSCGLVLVADDDPTFAEATSDFLRANGYCTAIARNGQEAFAQVTSNRVDCLLLDLCMPILSGIEVYLKLRESACSVPTIIVSAFAHEIPEWLAAEQILIKPFDPALLIKAIKRILEGCRVEAA
jgi:two-component system response regulator HydG